MHLFFMDINNQNVILESENKNGAVIMKIRKGFVTNSSSSSFILAKRNNDFTEEQKEAIFAYVKGHMLGRTKISTKEQLDEYYKRYGLFKQNGEIDEDEYYYDEYMKLLGLIQKGYSIYKGDVSFDESELFYLYEGIWESIKRVDPEDFIGVDTDLSY